MKNRFFYKTILLAVIIFFTQNCEAEKEKDFFGYGEEELSLVLTGLVLNQGFVDLRDGTVLDNQSNIIYEKCTAGQNYNANANDCRGGQSPSLFTPDDVVRWGAEKLGFCDTNTWACNQRFFPYALTGTSPIAVPGKSAAYNFCESKNQSNGFPGWRVATPPELLRLTLGGRLALLELFPDTQQDWYWSSWGNAEDLEGTTGIAVSFEQESFGEEKDFAKTTKYYVRCVRPKTPVSRD